MRIIRLSIDHSIPQTLILNKISGIIKDWLKGKTFPSLYSWKKKLISIWKHWRRHSEEIIRKHFKAL